MPITWDKPKPGVSWDEEPGPKIRWDPAPEPGPTEQQGPPELYGPEKPLRATAQEHLDELARQRRVEDVEQTIDTSPLSALTEPAGKLATRALESPLGRGITRVAGQTAEAIGAGPAAAEATLQRGAAAVSRALPGQIQKPIRAAAAAIPEEPLAAPIAEKLTAGHPLGQGWPGALYEGGVQTAAGLTAPKGLAMLAGLAFAPEGAQPIVDAYFSGQMAVGAKRKFEEAWQLYRSGDPWGAKVALTEAGITAGMSALPLLHAREKPAPAKQIIDQPVEEAMAPAKEPDRPTRPKQEIGKAPPKSDT